MMKRRLQAFCLRWLLVGLMAFNVSLGVQTTAIASELSGDAVLSANPTITVYRSPSCGCCGKWIDHLREHGFQVDEQVTEDMDTIKQQYGIPEEMASCHTAIANGYAIEGHVPAADVQRLLTEQPAVAGIAVPGMPMGSPGMDMGETQEAFTVFSFDEAGTATAFQEYKF